MRTERRSRHTPQARVAQEVARRGAGGGISGAEFAMRGAGVGIPGVRIGIPGEGFATPSPGIRISGAGIPTPGAGFEISSPRLAIPGTGIARRTARQGARRMFIDNRWTQDRGRRRTPPVSCYFKRLRTRSKSQTLTNPSDQSGGPHSSTRRAAKRSAKRR